MENQIEIVNNVAEGMVGIGGNPSNEEFYAEFNMRLRAALKISEQAKESQVHVCKCCGSTKTYITEAVHCTRCAVTQEI